MKINLIDYIGNLKISFKLFLLTGIPLFFLIIVSVFAIISLRNQKNALVEIFELRNPHLELAGSLYDQVLSQRILLENFLRDAMKGTDDEKMQSMEKGVKKSLEEVLLDVENALASKDYNTEEKIILDSLSQFTKRFQTAIINALRFSKNPSFLSMNMEVAFNHFESLKSKVIQLKKYEKELSQNRYKSTLGQIGIALNVLILLTITVFAVSFITFVIVSGFINRPLKKCVSFAHAIAEGDLSQSLESLYNDETGNLVHALNTMQINLKNIIKSVQDGINSLAHSSKALRTSFTTLESQTDHMKNESISVASATEQAVTSFKSITIRTQAVSESVNNIYSSIEKLSEAFAEVSRNCHNELDFVTQANEESLKTKAVMENQNSAASKIEGISEIISHITGQVKLLSLNARIQAASAGEAGKGFAVVASEIKGLSLKTGNATEEIGSNIKEMRKSTVDIISFVENIFTMIGEINSISKFIVDSIEEQFKTINGISGNLNNTKSASQEISTNINEAAMGISLIAKSMNSVDSTVAEVYQEAMVLKENVKIIEDLSVNLNGQISQFRF